ncbi:MAG TPA: TetR family transcriptional regulator [Pseudonocardiaceae bacterium]
MTSEEVPAGLRERKKARTRAAISAAAIALFLERGFDAVSVVEIAAAAEVSKRTLFAYFPAKEDLVLHRIADHEQESAEVVRARPPGRAVLDALHEHFLDGLRRRDPVTGLNAEPEPLALYEMLTSTPSLALRLRLYLARSEEALAAALAETARAPLDPLVARLAAAQITAVQRTLADDNIRRVVDSGERQVTDRLHRDAVAAADRAFTLLRTGLGAALG